MRRATISLQPRDDAPHIPADLYGHFAEHLGHCIYGGLWVGEDSPIPNTRGIRNDVVAALKELNLPVLRWPGGCFADEYHWKDGVGPRDLRPSIYNTHWGGVVENNHFGTHEFFDLCEQVGCEAYICGNVGSGTVQEMSQWVEYMTSPAHSPMADWRRQNGREEPWKVKYFGVGNESWGCGGEMRPEYYADEYRRYQTFVRNYGQRITKIACGPNTADYNWTEVMMSRATRFMDGLALHYYTILDQKWPPSSSATNFGEKEYRSIIHAALHMDELITKHSAVMDKHDPEKRVALMVDEWGVWHLVEPGTNPGFLYQQNTVRDALVAALTFDIFHRHVDRVKMGNIAQMVNVLQAIVLTDGPKMVRTPTYWAFHLYKGHHGAQVVPSVVTAESSKGDGQEIPSVSATASRNGSKLTVTASCLEPKECVTVAVSGLPAGARVSSARVLSGPSMQSHNTFDQPDLVSPKDLPVRFENGTLEFDLGPFAVATIELS